MDVVDEGPLAVDLDDRQPLAVARLELGLAVDGDLASSNAELVTQRATPRERPLAEVAAARRGRRRLEALRIEATRDRGFGDAPDRDAVGRERMLICCSS